MCIYRIGYTYKEICIQRDHIDIDLHTQICMYVERCTKTIYKTTVTQVNSIWEKLPQYH